MVYLSSSYLQQDKAVIVVIGPLVHVVFTDRQRLEGNKMKREVRGTGDGYKKTNKSSSSRKRDQNW